MSSGSYPSLLRAWTRSSSLLFNSMLEANRAAVAAFGVTANGDGADDKCRTLDSDRTTPVRVEPAGALEEWDIERETTIDDDLTVGDYVRFSKTLTETDVLRFATASGDTNPIHLDEGWAEDSRFGSRIVHGTLVSGLISAALARLPGSVIYLSQDVEFLKPVRLGDRVTATVEVVENLDADRYRLTTQIENADGDFVIDGEATVLIDTVPDAV